MDQTIRRTKSGCIFEMEYLTSNIHPKPSVHMEQYFFITFHVPYDCIHGSLSKKVLENYLFHIFVLYERI